MGFDESPGETVGDGNQLARRAGTDYLDGCRVAVDDADGLKGLEIKFFSQLAGKIVPDGLVVDGNLPWLSEQPDPGDGPFSAADGKDEVALFSLFWHGALADFGGGGWRLGKL